jgi:WD40 repeat protein
MRFSARLLLSMTTAIVSALIATAGFAAPAMPAFKSLPSIPAGDDLWDFASWDNTHHRLIVAHGKDVLVIDPATSAVRPIGKIAYAHAVVPLPGTDQILVTSKLDNTVRILDASSGAELVRIDVAADPDATVLSADGHKAYVMAAKAGAISVVDLDRKVESGRIPLKTGLEVAVLATPTLLAVNSEDFDEIELADLEHGKAAAPSPAGLQRPHGSGHGRWHRPRAQRLRQWQAALVDIAHRKVVRMLPIGAGPDTVIWDAKHHRFLVPCGESATLSVINLDGKTAHVAARSTPAPMPVPPRSIPPPGGSTCPLPASIPS